ncbi:MAG: HrcA family transcriptional regulator, partial [bacterium]
EGKHSGSFVDVTIGSENEVKEFRNFSMISSTYCVNGRALGLVGILGPKRMEYPRMISLVNAVSEMMGGLIGEWEKAFPLNEDGAAPVLVSRQAARKRDK